MPLHHEVGWEEVARSNAGYGEYVRHERRRLGAGHPLFLSQYELRTVEAAGRLLSPSQLAALEGSHAALSLPVAGERYVAGLDCAGEGERADASVLTIARLAGGGRCDVVAHAAWRSAAYARLTAEVTALARLWRLERLTVDATGLGGPIAAQLRGELGPRVEPFTFTSASKAALGFALIASAETGRLTLYRDDGGADAAAVRRELSACGGDFRAAGGLAWGNARGNDDYVASLALCLHAAERVPPARRATGRARD